MQITRQNCCNSNQFVVTTLIIRAAKTFFTKSQLSWKTTLLLRWQLIIRYELSSCKKICSTQIIIVCCKLSMISNPCWMELCRAACRHLTPTAGLLHDLCDTQHLLQTEGWLENMKQIVLWECNGLQIADQFENSGNWGMNGCGPDNKWLTTGHESHETVSSVATLLTLVDLSSAQQCLWFSCLVSRQGSQVSCHGSYPTNYQVAVSAI